MPFCWTQLLKILKIDFEISVGDLALAIALVARWKCGNDMCQMCGW